jgi:hypothetical protein
MGNNEKSPTGCLGNYRFGGGNCDGCGHWEATCKDAYQGQSYEQTKKKLKTAARKYGTPVKVVGEGGIEYTEYRL